MSKDLIVYLGMVVVEKGTEVFHHSGLGYAMSRKNLVELQDMAVENIEALATAAKPLLKGLVAIGANKVKSDLKSDIQDDTLETKEGYTYNDFIR